MLAPLLIKGAKITMAGLGSVVLGFLGLILLFLPDLASNSGNTNWLGAAAIIFASGCFAIALLMLKNMSDEHPLIVARNVLATASVQILAVAWLISPVSEITITTSSATAVVYLGLMCAGIVYFLYIRTYALTDIQKNC